jgi:hypothetical protein
LQRTAAPNDEEYIKAEYRKASLGEMSSAALWQRLGVSPALEDQYLTLNQLTPGLREFLNEMPKHLDALGIQ